MQPTEHSEAPYIIEMVPARKYNPKFGDSRICECGHSYHRHFDSYEDNDPCGCKYCECFTFVEKSQDAYEEGTQ